MITGLFVGFSSSSALSLLFVSVLFGFVQYVKLASRQF